MDWSTLANSMQRAITGSALAELVTLTSSDDASTVSVRGMYDRPPVIDETGGVDFRGADHRVSIREADRPAWCDRGAKVSVRGVELVVEELVHDGQGLVELDCNRAT